MKRFIAIFLCIIYTTVSFGGSVYMHNCCGGTSFSIYEKAGHDVCPLCTKKQDRNSSSSSDHKTCSDGKCSDVEIKIDQLANKLFSSHSPSLIHFSPAVLTRFWISIRPVSFELIKEKQPSKSAAHDIDTSPPTFLLNCIFRI